jgi:hypothetical protein
MAEWREVDILVHFPKVATGEKIKVHVDGKSITLTREDVIQRWASYCAEARDDTSEKQHDKEFVVDVVTGRTPRKPKPPTKNNI